MAASLACGYLGMIEQIKPSAPATDNAYDDESTLPHTLREAVDELLDCEPLREILGDRFVRLFASIKHHEYNTFLNVISAWEREHPLLNV